MVRKLWVFVALAVGTVAGFLLRGYLPSSPEAHGETAKAIELPAPAVPVVADEKKAVQNKTPSAPPAAPAPMALLPAPAASPAPGTVPVASSGAFLAGDFVNAPNGKPIEYADPLHEEFLHEERDDSWAYLREAELESSMVMELSEGHFKKDRIECRASICEVELSATGDQVAKLSEWMEQKDKQRSFSLEQPLMMRGASFQGNGQQGRARILYMKPERVLPPPRKS